MNIWRMCLFAFVFLFFQQTANAQLTYNELRVEYDSSWTYRNLQLIPVRFKEKKENLGIPVVPAPRTLSFLDALQKHKINVQEIQYKYGADANWLQITNESKQDVIIQSGEMVAGGKQDRMIAETKLIAPGKTEYVNVFCIEKRRWDDKPKKFRHGGVANSKVRKVMDVGRRQSEVWKEIDQQFKDRNKKSETWSYLELNASTADTGYIRFFTGKYLKSDSNIAGFIFVTGNRIISTELFSTARFLQISFANLLSSYVQSVISKGSPPAVPKATMESFMDKVLLNEEAQKKYIALHGRIYLSGENKMHLIAYPD
jgi:hypothetical protein